MKKLAGIFFFALSMHTGIILSQSQATIDSLLNRIENAEDTVKINLLNKLASEVLIRDLDLSLSYATKALDLSDERNYTRGKAEATCTNGMASFHQGNYQVALLNLEAALKLFKSMKNLSGEVICRNYIGQVHLKTGNEEQAHIIFLKALNIAQNNDDKEGIALSLLNLGEINKFSGNYDASFQFRNSALDIYKELNNKKGVATCLQRLGVLYKELSNYDEALRYYREAYLINKDIGSSMGIASTFSSMGSVHKYMGNYDSAISYFQQALVLNTKLRQKRQIAYHLGQMGEVQRLYANYLKALEYYQKELSIIKEIGDKRLESYLLMGIGIVHLMQENRETALQYLTSCLDLAMENGDKRLISRSLNEIGALYIQQEKFEDAIVNINQALAISEEIGSKTGIAESFFLLGVISESQNKNTLALEYFQKAIRLHEELGQLAPTAETSIKSAHVLFKMQRYDEVIRNATAGLKIAQEIGAKESIMQASEILAKAYAQLNDFENAFFYHKLYADARNEIFTREGENKIIAIESRFELERKEQEILLLNRNQEINENRILVQRLVIAFIAILILILAIVLIAFIQRAKVKQRINTLLENKNKKISLQAEKLTKANTELHDLNATKNKFFSIIAHDLRSPFNSINGMLDIIVSDFDDLECKEVKEMLTSAQNASNVAFSLVENLLEWSRTQIGGIIVNPKKLCLTELVEHNFKLYENIAQSKEIRLSNNVDSNVAVYADEAMLNTVFRNLISNAIKFTKKGGLMSISADVLESEVKVFFKDNGVGIKKEKIERLFRIDSNYRTNGTENEKGTGLGLFLCMEFIKQSGGEIIVTSTEGVGSTFTMNLPAKGN